MITAPKYMTPFLKSTTNTKAKHKIPENFISSPNVSLHKNFKKSSQNSQGNTFLESLLNKFAKLRIG